MNPLIFKHYLLLSLALLISQLISAQDLNQREVIKSFKPGKYKKWDVNSTFYTEEDGTKEVSFKYDDNGGVLAVIMGTTEFELAHVQDLYGNKVYTGTHFHNKSTQYNIAYYNGKLYYFLMYSGDSFREISLIIGKKSGDAYKASNSFKSYCEKIKEIRLEKEKELVLVAKKNNPESFYDEVYKEANGMKKVKSKEGKYGFLNSNNDLVIPCVYTDSYDSFNKGLVGVSLGKKEGYINKENKVIVKIDKEYVESITNDLIIAKEQNGTFNLYDLNGKVKFGPYDNAVINELNATIYIRKGTDHGAIDGNQKLNWFLKGKEYDEITLYKEFYRVKKGSKYGVFDPKINKEILAPRLDVIYEEKEGCFVVQHKKKFGLYNARKKGFITEVVYDDAFSFKNGKANVVQNGIDGYLGAEGKIVWDNNKITKAVNLTTPIASWRKNYDKSDVLYLGKCAVVAKGTKKGLVNATGNKVVDCKFQSLKIISGNFILAKSDNLFGALNSQGEVIVALEHTRAFDFYNGEMKFKKGNTFYWYDIEGGLTRFKEEKKISAKDKLISFYNDEGSFVSTPSGDQIDGFKFYDGFKTNHFGPVFVGKLRDKNGYFNPAIYLADNQSSLKIKGCKNTIIKGCEVDENHMILATNGYLIKQKLSNGVLGANTMLSIGDSFEPIEIQSIGNGKTISLWVSKVGYNKFNVFVYIWNHETDDAQFKKIASSIKYKPCLDVSEDKTRAMISYVNEAEELTTEVFKTNAESIAENLVVFWKKTSEKKRFKPIGCHFTKINEPITLYRHTTNTWSTLLFKYSEDGQGNASSVISEIATSKWTRGGGESIRLKIREALFFNKSGSIFFEENEKTGQMYIISRFEPDMMTYKYGSKKGYITSNVPCVVGIDEKTLKVDAFDIIETVKDGTLDYSVYKQMENALTYIKIELANAFVTDGSIYTIETMTNGGDKQFGVSFVWDAYLRRDAKKGNVKQLSSSNSNTSNSSSSSSSSSSSNSSVSSPKLVAVTINPNGKGNNYVHIHWSENGSSKKKTLQTKSTRSIGSIPEGTKLYYTTDNNTKKTYFYTIPKGKSSVSTTVN